MPDLWMDVDAALSEVPINLLPLLDDTDGKTREESVVYNQSGLDLVWNFVTTAGAMTQTAVTPTDTGGNYDWVNQGNGMYSIEIPASGGASINNDTEGFGWFTGFATGILPWRGPVIGFRAAGLNNVLVDDAHSATRGLAGTALPAAAADAAGGLAISDAGGLDLDAKLAHTEEVTAARMGALTDWINGGRLDLILDIIAADTTTDIPGLIAALSAALASAAEIGTAVAANASIAAALSSISTIAGRILGTLAAGTHNPQGGDAFARIGAPAGASVSADVAAVKAKTDLIITGIKQNTALAKFGFIMRDSTNHQPVTGKTVTVTRSIDGGAQAAGTISGTAEVSHGHYTTDLGAGDLNGKCIMMRATAAGCDDTMVEIVTSA